MPAKSILEDAAIYHQKGPFEAFVFGKPFDHSFSRLQARPELRARLAYIAEALEVSTILAPNPTIFNAALIPLNRLCQFDHLGELVSLWRNPDMPADVVQVPKGMAMGMSVGGCPAIVAHADEHLFAAHAGRDSVVHRARIKRDARLPLDTRDAERDAEGVVEQIVRAYTGLGVARTQINISVIGSIPAFYYPHRFDDPGYGAFNRALRDDILRHHPRFGEDAVIEHNDTVMLLDLPKLIAAQCVAMGLEAGRIDLSHAYADPALTWLDGTPGKERNLFMVVHR